MIFDAPSIVLGAVLGVMFAAGFYKLTYQRRLNKFFKQVAAFQQSLRDIDEKINKGGR